MKTVLCITPDSKTTTLSLHELFTFYGEYGKINLNDSEFTVGDTTYKFVTPESIDRIVGLDCHGLIIDEVADISEEQWETLKPRIKR